MPCPPATIPAVAAAATIPVAADPVVDAAMVVNPAYSFWIRQDQLILSAIISTQSPSLIPFIATLKTSRAAWLTLATNYGKPFRGRIIALKNHLHNPLKGSTSVTDFLQEIKSVVDELALIVVATDTEDLVLKVLNGLDESYLEISSAIQAHEQSIGFDELHVKLLSTKA